jgi:ABC-type cobalamin/Fe3+-siderophores transport system ATPase subunit
MSRSLNLTLILDANGLRKTTLLTLLFRMLTGLADIDFPKGRIGSANLKVENLDALSRRQFAHRVEVLSF